MSYDVGERIREFRKQAGLNQDQLAELSSLNRVTVAKYESGKVEPGAKAISRIADALEVSVDILLGRSTDEAITSPEQDEMILRIYDQPGKDREEQAKKLLNSAFGMQNGMQTQTDDPESVDI